MGAAGAISTAYGVTLDAMRQNSLARAGRSPGFVWALTPANTGSSATTTGLYASYYVMEPMKVRRHTWFIQAAATSNANFRVAPRVRRNSSTVTALSGTTLQLSKTKSSGKTLALQSIGVASLTANLSVLFPGDQVWLSIKASNGGGAIPTGFTYTIECEKL